MASNSKDLHRVIDDQKREILRLNKCISELIIPGEQSNGSTQLLSGTDCNEDTPTHAESQLASTEIDLAFPALMRGLTTKQDVKAVASLCRTIVGDDAKIWQPLLKTFFELVLSTRDDLSPEIAALERTLPEDWFHEPWYLAYVQYTGVENEEVEGDFDTFRRILPYIRNDLGFQNLCLLPHYQSPMADGGYDVSDYRVRDSLGGADAFSRFMDDARALGMRVATDAVFNHTSTEHAWFQQAVAGDERYIRYYVQRNGREKIDEWDRDGDVVCQYRDPDGTLTERTVVFPDVDRTHGLWVEINGKTFQFYRTFFPFQVDLNLRNADVLVELLRILADEVKLGVLAKRTDAVVHWVKKPGSASDGLEETHALQALFKRFLKHLHRRAVVMPEAVRDAASAATYAGARVTMNGEDCAEEGDAILAFDMQGALRETTLLQSVAPFWRKTFDADVLHEKSVWVNVLEHHDEMYLGFFCREVRRWIADYVQSRNGYVFKNGMSAGGRMADCLDGDARRIATAVFMLYMAHGAPMVYAGLEVCAGNAWRHAQARKGKRKKIFERVGVYVDDKSCFDGRELHRGTLVRSDLMRAAACDAPVVTAVRRLNRLYGRCAWMRHTAVAVDCDDLGVFCGGRGTGRVLCVGNLTGVDKSVRVPLGQAERALGISDDDWTGGFEDLLTGGDVDVLKCESANCVEIRVAAFEHFIVCARGCA